MSENIDTKITALKLTCSKQREKLETLYLTKKKLKSAYDRTILEMKNLNTIYKNNQRDLLLLQNKITICPPKTDKTQRITRKKYRKKTMREMINETSTLNAVDKKKLLETLTLLQTADQRNLKYKERSEQRKAGATI